MRSSPPFTVPISAVQGLLSGAPGAAEGWRAAVLVRAGIDAALLGLPGSRVTLAQYLALFSAASDSLGMGAGDEALGQLSRPLRRGSLVLMARATLGARTLDAALLRLADAFSLLQEDVTLRPVVDADAGLRGFALVFQAPERHGNFAHELLLRVFWRLLAWLHGGRLQPRRFDWGSPAPAYAADYPDIFPAPLRFAAPHTAAWFDAAALQGPMRRDVHALETFLRATPGNLVGPHLAGQGTSARLRSLLQRHAPDWLHLQAAAEHLHMSASALQRHLAQEGTSFQALKDQLRRDLAIHRLSTGRQSLAGLAAELGFTDSTAFQRAFKRWTGSPPGRYRI